jgi:CRISPR-associated endonuclease Cas3-HD
MVEKFLAKSVMNGGGLLIDHSKAVTNFAVFVFENIINPNIVDTTDISYDDIKNSVIIASAMHDIGKCYDKVQEYLKCPKQKKGFYMASDDEIEPINKKKETITHNVLSWAYLKQHMTKNDAVLSAILNHHVVYDYLSDYSATSLNALIEENECSPAFEEFFGVMSQYIKETFGCNIEMKETDDNCYIKDVLITYDMAKVDTNSFEQNSLFTIIRSILIYADRMVSGHFNDTDKFINYDNNFMKSILDSSVMVNDMPVDNVNTLKDDNGNFVYSQERLKGQNELLDVINSSNNYIVGASAGYGKTLVGIRWAMNSKKKVLWVVPRNVIARGTYLSVISEIEKMGYSNQLSVGLLLSGYYEEGDENSDIIVTNIDNFLASMVKNGEAHHLINLLNSNVIFDEYHEFLSEAPLFSAFISIVYTRTHFTDSRTILLSATPLRFDKIFWNDGEEYVKFINPTPFNGEMGVNISFNVYSTVREVNCETKDSFVICNTVNQAQQCFESNGSDDKILIHSRFTKTDRNSIEDKIYSFHDKNSDISCRNTVVGTNIIGVGLDVSAKSIYDFVISPENTIQRGCGRGGRFAEKEYNNEINYHVCILSNDTATKRLTSRMYDSNLHSKWVGLLENYDGKKITKNELYKLYYQFYEDNEKEAFKLWMNFFKQSCDDLKRLKPFSSKKKKEKDEKVKLSTGIGFRGNVENIFVTAKKDNGTMSDPITVMKVIINNKALPAEYDKEALKDRYDYLFGIVEDFKYICNNWFNLGDLPYNFALSEETPFLLKYSTYNSIYGLLLNANSPSKAFEDNDLD